ncbi:MAG TPA: AMP-binding protein [Acidimicrobiales bacterium]|nr:AMP-binding protein [Acidimicrobiales bacterium]
MALLTDHLRAMAGAFPDTTGYRVVDGGQMTFAQWEAESNRLARALTDLGVRKGDRVSLYLEAAEALRFMVAYSAVHKAGAVAVPTNNRLSDKELHTLLGHAEVRAVLTDASRAPMARELERELPCIDHVLEAPLSEETGEPAWSWGDTVACDDTSAYQVALGPEDLADILYTSGTTGMPKGVAIRHRSVALIPGEPNPHFSGGCWLHSSPLFTFAGIGFIYNPMQLGLMGVYQPRFDAGRWLQVVQELRPQFVFLVPSMAQLLVAHPDFDEADLTSIELCAIGSAPLAPATLRTMQERMPEAAVSNSYGMTEAGAAYCAMPKGESLKRIGSVGQPMPPLEVRFVDEEGEDVGPGEVGEVLLRMPGREREYYRNPEATAATWQGGWLHTGDLGRLDGDGYLYIVGRKKDIIIRGGNNVHAVDVESVLLDHPDVVEAAVVGVPHTVLGEDVAAVVVLSPDAKATVDDIREHCAGRLADYKVPRRIEVTDELPRNATGKVLKPRLREQLVGHTADA